jgi:hypothetical protein
MNKDIKKMSAVGGVFLAWALFAAQAQAQFSGPRFGGSFGTPPPTPAVSPYLNLLNTGDPAINYYGLVRPQFATNRALQNLGSELNYLESAPGGNPALQQQFFQTGIRSGFQTHYRYFMTNGFPGGARGGSRSGSLPGTSGGGSGQTYGAYQAPQAPVAPRGY